MTKEQESLLRYANSSGAFDGQELTWESIAEHLANPDWSKSGPWEWKWEEHLPIGLPQIWNSLPLEAKIMARIMAEEIISLLMMYVID